MAHKRKADCTPEEWEKVLERMRARRKRLREANPGLEREIARRYREKHREKYNAKNRKWAQEYSDKVRKAAARCFEKYREKYTAYQLEWRKNNPDKVRAVDRAYRMRKHNRREAVPLFEKVLALIPRQIEARFDIASEAMILILEGKALTPEEAIKIGRKKHYKLFSQFDKKTVSLDAPLRDGRSLHDIIAGEAA